MKFNWAKVKKYFSYFIIIFCHKVYGFSFSAPLLIKELPEDMVVSHEVASSNIDSEKDLTQFSHGVLAYERGDLDEAKSYLVSSLAQVELAPYTYYYLGKIAVEMKNLNAAYAAFEEALKFKPQFDLKRNIKYAMANIQLAKNKLPEARRLFLESRKRFKRTEFYPEILWNLFVIDNKQNSPSQCVWFRYIFESYPNYEMAKSWTLDSNTWLLNEKPINCRLGFNSKYRYVSQLIALGDYDKVKVALEIAKTTLPRLDYLELLANYELRAGNPELAFDELSKDYETYSKDSKFLQLYIKVSSRALKHDESIKLYNEIIALEKNIRVKAGYIFRKGFLEYELGLYDKAYDTFLSVQNTYANNPYQGDVTWYLGWTAYLQKKYDVALVYFGELNDLVNRRKYIRSRDSYSAERVKYWMAHSYLALGDSEKAKEFFNEVINGEKLNYYAFLSSVYLQDIDSKSKKDSKKDNSALLASLKIPWTKTSESVEFEPQNYVMMDRDPELRSYLTPESQNQLASVFDQDKYQLNIKRFKLLLKSGFHEDAKWELQELEKKAKDKAQKIELVQLYRQLNDAHRASKIMTLSFQSERDSTLENINPFEMWSNTYPRPHQNYVSGSAEKFQVPENLVYSIMRAESFYSQTAMSGVGARGLLQLMPFTANQVSDLMGGAQDIEPQQLFEADTNIKLGVKYLNRLLRTFSGDKILAIAAYNAGPHRAEWWVSRFGNLRQDEFIEHILFLETRNYVKKVMRFNWIYDLLYDNQVTLADMKNPINFQLTRAPSLTEKWEPLTH